MPRKTHKSVESTSAKVEQEAPPVEQVAQTEPTTEPNAETSAEAPTQPTTEPKPMSASEQIAQLKAQLAALQSAAKAEQTEAQKAREEAVKAAQTELDALTPAYEEAWAAFKPIYDRKHELLAIINPAKVKGQRSSNGQGKAPGNHRGDPTEGKGLTAHAFRVLARNRGSSYTVKELFQASKLEGWTPKEGAVSDDAKSMAQLSSSLVQELKRPTPFVTRPEAGKYQVA